MRQWDADVGSYRSQTRKQKRPADVRLVGDENLILQYSVTVFGLADAAHTHFYQAAGVRDTLDDVGQRGWGLDAVGGNV